MMLILQDDPLDRYLVKGTWMVTTNQFAWLLLSDKKRARKNVLRRTCQEERARKNVIGRI